MMSSNPALSWRIIFCLISFLLAPNQFVVVSFTLPPPRPSFVSFSVPGQVNKCQYDQASLCTTNLPFVGSLPRLIAGSKLLASSSVDTDDTFLQAQDLEALQALFLKHCDKEGLMTKAAVMAIPAIAELVEEGDLLVEEFNDIWRKAPKFPETSEERVDVDSFVQLYRDIDDLFVDDDLEQEAAPTDSTSSASQKDSGGDVSQEENELETIFESLRTEDGKLSRKALGEWDEITDLIKSGLLGEDELDILWEKTAGKGAGEIDLKGFLSFNEELDSLFDLEEEEGEYVEGIGSVDDLIGDQSDLSSEELFAAISDSNNMVGKTELSQWTDLSDMIRDGELSSDELDAMYAKCAGSAEKLDLKAFMLLYNAIDDLFEEYDEDEVDDNTSKSNPQQSINAHDTGLPKSSAPSEAKTALLRALEILNTDDEVLPCGLEASPDDQKRVMNIVNALESEPDNIVRLKKGALTMEDLAGTWELLYSSSSAMRFNKGLSGLGGSFPNGKFGGLKQKLIASKFMTDVEYTEHIEVNPSSASFDVTVTGGWELRTSVSLFTGQPSTVLTVEPERVTYGPTSTRADHWKSLGPMNMLDVTYLDDTLRVMRGNTSVETIFVFRRIY